MSKFRILARKCAALLLLLHCLVAAPVQLLREKVQHQCSSLTTMIRRIFSLKNRFFSLRKCSSSNTFPNFAQENDDLREGNDISPVESEWYGFAPVDEGASIYLSDEYDEEDYDSWLSDEEWLDLIDDEEEEIQSWITKAVNDAIAEEKPGQYPPGNMGDIPF